MALADRIRAALGPQARLEDCRTVLAEAEAALPQAQAKKAEAEEHRLDPSLSAEQAAEAQLDAEEWRLEELRLGRAIDKLRETIQRRDAEAAAAAEKRRKEQATHRRDKLAEELRERVPALFAELVDLFQRIEASDAEISGMGMESAEAVARGISGPFGIATGPARLTKVKLPRFQGPGHCWPVDRHNAAAVAVMESEQRQFAAARAEQDPAAIAARLAAVDARHALYRVQQESYRGTPVHGITHRGGTTSVYGLDVDDLPAVLEMDESQVLAARAKGIRCDPAADVARYLVVDPRWRRHENARWIETANGRTPIDNERGPTRCFMSPDQVQAAEAAGLVVKPADAPAKAGRRERRQEAA